MIYGVITTVIFIAVFAAGCTQNSDTPEGNVPDINPNAEAANKDTTDITLFV